MPYQNIVRRRRLRAQAGPPVLDLLVQYLASAVGGPGGVNPVDGAQFGTWVPYESSVEDPNLVQVALTDRPTWVATDGYGHPVVMFGVAKSMTAAFAPPQGSAPRTIVLIGADWTVAPQTELVRYGTSMPPTAGALFGVEVGLTGKFGWNLGNAVRGESPVAATNPPHAVVVTYDGSTILIQADDAGASSQSAAADTGTAVPLTVGGTLIFGVYELRVYGRALSLEEIEDVLVYSAATYGTPAPK